MAPIDAPNAVNILAEEKDEIFEATGCVGAVRPRSPGKNVKEKVLAVDGPPKQLQAGMDKS